MRERGGVIDGKEVWTATDDLVCAQIANKGMSKLMGLSGIIWYINYEDQHNEVFWYPFRVSGKQMIKMGFERLLQGDFDSRIMLGRDIWTLVPLWVSAVNFEENQILDWTRYLVRSDLGSPLAPEVSVLTRYQPCSHLWVSLPASALFML